MKRMLIAVGLLAACAVLAGCAHQPSPDYYVTGPGFWMGLVHGFVALPSVVIGFFTDVRIYAFPNVGWRYDLGFLIGSPMTWGWIAMFMTGK